jgi:replicative DNA helicase
MAYEGTPTPLRDCPICHSTDKRCRQRNNLILCMNRIDGGDKEKFKSDNGIEYTYLGRAVGAGEWGEWAALPEIDKEEREKIKNERLAHEGSNPAYDMPACDRNTNYTKILNQLTLKQYDLSDLLRRGFTESQIKELQFRSVDKFHQLYEEVDWRTPGVTPSGRTLYIMGERGGYLCPVRDIDGNIVAMQVRLREGSEGGRYRWLSSQVKKRPNCPTYRSNGEMPLAIFNRQNAGGVLWLVEGVGPKPAWVSVKYPKSAVVGAAGAQWGYSPSGMKIILDRLKPKRIILAADAGCVQVDKGGNQHTIARYQTIADLLKIYGYSLEVAWWGQETKEDFDIDELDDHSSIKSIPFEELLAIASRKKQEYENQNFETFEDPSQSLDAALPEIPTIEIGQKPLDDAPWRVRVDYALRQYLAEEDDIQRIFLKNEAIKDFFSGREKDFYAAITYLEKTHHDNPEQIAGALDDTIHEMSQDFEEAFVPTGHPDLDDKIGGIASSVYWVMPAQPNTGKTALLLHLMRQYAKKLFFEKGLYQPIVFFSLESTRVNVCRRLLAQEAEVDAWRLRTGKLWDSEVERVLQAQETLKRLPIFIDPTPSISPHQIRRKLLALHQKYGRVPLVAIDHAHIMSGDGHDELARIGNISKNCQAMSREFNTCLILLAQMNQDQKNRADKTPQTRDIRYGTQIMMDADLISFLYRPEMDDPDTYEKGLMKIFITKQREGRTGNVSLLFDPDKLMFKDAEE